VQVRHPTFDFTGISPMWADNAEAVHSLNAQGIVPAYIEPFLIKVMRRAKAELDPVQHADLIADLEIFSRQEAQHYKFHAALNKWIRQNGYEGMESFERSYEAEYEEMLAARPLKWLLAYCEGFESMGLLAADWFVDGGFESELPRADPRPIALWKWHLAEEYEHRSVAFRVLKALYGGNRSSFYLLRVSGFFNASRHIGDNVVRLQRYLLATYREREGIPAPARKRMSRSQLRQLKGVFGVLSPFYDPARKKAPMALDQVLASI
jgi:uncharacterized protein